MPARGDRDRPTGPAIRAGRHGAPCATISTLSGRSPAATRYPVRWKRIKQEFTRRYLKAGREEVPPSRSRVRHAEPGIWQRRYWEHTIEDEDDLKRCVDDAHWDPKKHRYVANVRDWPWSSFHRFVTMGEYTPDQGPDDPVPAYDDPAVGRTSRSRLWWGSPLAGSTLRTANKDSRPLVIPAHPPSSGCRPLSSPAPGYQSFGFGDQRTRSRNSAGVWPTFW